MKNFFSIKALGLLATIGSLGISLLSSFVSEKTTDAMIENKIQKALAERDKKGK